jgi:hypothetical protein
MLGHSIVSQNFMEPESSIPNSQELSTCSYPEPDQSSPHWLFTQSFQISPTFMFSLALLLCCYQCLDNSVGIATGYRSKVRVSIPGTIKRFYGLHTVQPYFGAHLDSYPVGPGVSSPGSKLAGEWSLKHISVYTSTLQHVFKVWCSIN